MNTKKIVTLCFSLASILGTTQAQIQKSSPNTMSFSQITIQNGIKDLVPGDDAPNFHLTAIDGREITLGDCVGSYVLIYYWGLCPGSKMIDEEVIELYDKYKDKLILIGITESIEAIKESYHNIIKSENEILAYYESVGRKIARVSNPTKIVFENMLAHPWFDAETKTGNNKKIEVDYNFEGCPYFVFISPEGKIIARDFQEAFYIAKEKMESEFGK